MSSESIDRRRVNGILLYGRIVKMGVPVAGGGDPPIALLTVTRVGVSLPLVSGAVNATLSVPLVPGSRYSSVCVVVAGGGAAGFAGTGTGAQLVDTHVQPVVAAPLAW